MPIAIGMVLLAAFFIVFGSKEKEASILYYDMEETSPESNEEIDAPQEVEASLGVSEMNPKSDQSTVLTSDDAQGSERVRSTSAPSESQRLARELYESTRL